MNKRGKWSYYWGGDKKCFSLVQLHCSDPLWKKKRKRRPRSDFCVFHVILYNMIQLGDFDSDEIYVWFLGNPMNSGQYLVVFDWYKGTKDTAKGKLALK